MATLGELTAGIAHEIKNPLNFVTNFADVSHEMIQEAIHAESDEERGNILTDLRINLGKIREHGHRADSIVPASRMISIAQRLFRLTVEAELPAR